MFRVNKQTKTLEKVEKTTFKEVACKERQDLQEWIISNPSMLGEELLIIQKEFSEFDNTKERLDLLALDKSGNLVIIENKTDDTGKDVVWQAIKYASYCSVLIKDEIKAIYQKYLNNIESKDIAENLLIDFFDKEDFADLRLNEEKTQRIIFVAKEFRPEVTSAVTWLMKYGIKIACIKVEPYKLNDEIILDVEQIIPQKETADFTMKLINKSIEEQQQKDSAVKRYNRRNRFWKQFIPEFQKQYSLFDGVSPDKEDHWISAGSGISGMTFAFIICADYVAVELTIARPVREENKFIYDEFLKLKNEVEKDFGANLEWERLNDKKMCRITIRNFELSLIDEDQWSEINGYLIDNMIRLHKSLKPYIDKIRTLLMKHLQPK